MLALMLGAALLAQVALAPQAHARAPLAAIVVDARTGKVLFARNADAARYPASISKVMTLYLLFREIRAGRLSLKSRLRVSRHASLQSPSKLWLKPGQTITVDQAIRALAVKSANDVAVVVAENIAGSEAAFARRMTLMARALGMTRTTFRNASGLPRPVNISTARDLATLSLRLMRDFPTFYKRYFGLKHFRWRGRALRNHNHLLWRVAGMDGIKTGYTRAAGSNLAASVRRNGRRIVAVVLSAPSSRARNAYMARLIERTFRRHRLARGTRIAALAGRPPGYDPARARRMLAQVERLSTRRVAAKRKVAPKVRSAQATVVIPARGQSLKLAKLALQAAVIPPVETGTAGRPDRPANAKPPKPTRRPANTASQARLASQPAPLPAPRPQHQEPREQAMPKRHEKHGQQEKPAPRSGQVVIAARPLAARVAVRVPEAPPLKGVAFASADTRADVPAEKVAQDTGGMATLVKTEAKPDIADSPDSNERQADDAGAATQGMMEIAKQPVNTGASASRTATPTGAAAEKRAHDAGDADSKASKAAPLPQPAAAVAVVAAADVPARPKAPMAAEEIIFPQPERARELMRARWLIQIGAFPTIDGARTYLNKARRLSRNVRGRQPVVIRVRKGGNVFYRARYAGMSRKQAMRACRELKRGGLGCLPIAPGAG